MVCINPTGHMVHLQASLGLSIFFDVPFSFRWMGTLLMLQLIVGVLRVRQEYIGYLLISAFLDLNRVLILRCGFIVYVCLAMFPIG